MGSNWPGFSACDGGSPSETFLLFPVVASQRHDYGAEAPPPNVIPPPNSAKHTCQTILQVTKAELGTTGRPQSRSLFQFTPVPLDGSRFAPVFGIAFLALHSSLVRGRRRAGANQKRRRSAFNLANR